jgi:hypothetical protein
MRGVGHAIPEPLIRSDDIPMCGGGSLSTVSSPPVLWIRIRKDPKLFQDPDAELKVTDPELDFKGTVSRDFRPSVFFSSKHPSWAPD